MACIFTAFLRFERDIGCLYGSQSKIQRHMCTMLNVTVNLNNILTLVYFKLNLCTAVAPTHLSILAA